jgi:glyoxylate reductase
MPIVLLTRRFPDPVMTELASRFTLIGNLEDRSMSRSALLEQVGQAEALVVTLADKVDVELLERAPCLKAVAVFAVGYNNVDLAAASAHGIIVTNTPDVLTETTADLTWGLILAVARRIPEGERVVREGRWTGWSPTQFLGTEVHGRTLGIIGMGRIGQAVARRAGGFRMPVLYTNRSALPQAVEHELAATFRPLPDLLASSDFVSLHVPLSVTTHHLIGKAELGLMRRNAFLINTARGPVVDEAALAEALIEGKLAGAGLDVYEQEPRIHPALLTLPNVVLLPHLGSATYDTRVRMGMMVVDNLSAVFAGKEPPNRVRAPRNSA